MKVNVGSDLRPLVIFVQGLFAVLGSDPQCGGGYTMFAISTENFSLSLEFVDLAICLVRIRL